MNDEPKANAMRGITPELIAEGRRLLEKMTPLANARMVRYDHGGGRLATFDAEKRELIADFYNEGDREFYYWFANNAAALLDAAEELDRTRQQLVEEKANTNSTLAFAEELQRAVGIDPADAAMSGVGPVLLVKGHIAALETQLAAANAEIERLKAWKAEAMRDLSIG